MQSVLFSMSITAFLSHREFRGHDDLTIWRRLVKNNDWQMSPFPLCVFPLIWEQQHVICVACASALVADANQLTHCEIVLCYWTRTIVVVWTKQQNRFAFLFDEKNICMWSVYDFNYYGQPWVWTKVGMNADRFFFNYLGHQIFSARFE